MAPFWPADSASFLVEIGGTQPGTEYDLLIVGGTATLNGTIDVTFIDLDGGGNTFVPALGDEFIMINTFAGLFGGFATENLPTIAGGFGWDVVYNEDELILQVIEASLAADFDEDGDADGQDFLLWQASAGVDDGGDANGDGVTKDVDLLIWQSQFGLVPRAGMVRAIPEPSAAVLLVAAGILGVISTRQGSRHVPCIANGPPFQPPVRNRHDSASRGSETRVKPGVLLLADINAKVLCRRFESLVGSPEKALVNKA